MTNLTTKTAQSLHAEWCRQMWKKGFHGPTEFCSFACNNEDIHCEQFHGYLIPWPDLPESSRQEYLVTATAVLPEIVGGVFDEAVKVAVEWGCTTGGLEQDYRGLSANDFFERYGTNELMKAILNLRARRLEELK